MISENTTPPNSPESEEAVIACLLIDGADTLAAASDAGITAASFYSPANRLVYELAAELVAAGRGCEVDIVTAELRHRGQLEAIGGIDRLAAYLERAHTTAHRAYCLEHVRALEGCRLILDIAAAAADSAKHFQGTPEELSGAIADALGKFSAPGTKTATMAQIATAEAAIVRDEIAGKRARGIISTTLPTFDRSAGLLGGGELIVLAARPACGKTSLALQIAAHAAASGLTTLVFSLEAAGGALARVLAAQASGVSQSGIDRAHPDDQAAYLGGFDAARDKLGPMRVFDRTFALDEITARCRAESVRTPPSLVVIDYLQLIQPPKMDKGATREQQVAAMSRGLKLLAMSLGCPVLLLAQLNRGVETDNREPRLSDLRESGAIEQDANRVLLLHRPAADHDGRAQDINATTVEIKAILAKHRTGPTGQLFVAFHKPTQRFTELQIASTQNP